MDDGLLYPWHRGTFAPGAGYRRQRDDELESFNYVTLKVMPFAQECVRMSPCQRDQEGKKMEKSNWPVSAMNSDPERYLLCSRAIFVYDFVFFGLHSTVLAVESSLLKSRVHRMS